MKSDTMYGFPLFTILFNLFAMISLTLLTILIILIYGFAFFFLFLFLTMLYGYFFVIRFKTRFCDKRFKILQKMIGETDIKGYEIILDLGTGAGYIAIGYAKKLDNGRVYGIDKYDLKPGGVLSKILDLVKINFFGNTIANAKNNAVIEKQQNKTDFLEAELTKYFPFRNNSFDVVVASQFLYCVPQRKLKFVLSEINRVLKRGGVLVFFESKRFFTWDLDQVVHFFKQKGYEDKILNLNEFQNKVIFKARKPK